MPSTPKKLLGSLLEGKSEVSKLEEEVMSSRLKEVEAMAELKDLRLKVMDLETQTHVYHNQLSRKGEETTKLSDKLEESKKQEVELQTQLRSVIGTSVRPHQGDDPIQLTQIIFPLLGKYF